MHKVQSQSIEKVVVSFDLVKQRSFNYGQMYVALSRVTSLNGLYLTGQYDRKAIRADPAVTAEYERLRQTQLLTMPSITKLGQDNFIITLFNTRSLIKHASDIASTQSLVESDLLCITETQISLGNALSEQMDSLHDFRKLYNNNQDRFCSLAFLYRDSLDILNELSLPSFSIITVVKKSFSLQQLTILLLYRKNSQEMRVFMETLDYLLLSQSPDVVVGDFNINALKDNDGLMSTFEEYHQIVSEPTHLAGSLLDHVYIKKPLLDLFSIDCNVETLYFTDHDACRLVMKNK